MFLMDHFHLDGAGALAVLTLGLTASVAWRHGWPGGGACASGCGGGRVGSRHPHHHSPSCSLSWPRLAIGPGPTFARDVEHGVGALWWWLAQPLLFGMIGLNLDFARLEAGVADDALAVIASGWLPRPLLTALVVGGAGLSWRERAFVGAAWMPKASVQAALASGPLDAILARGLGPDWVAWGRACQVTATFAILVCATVGIVAVNVLSPLCLNKGPGVDALDGRGGGGGGGGTTVAEEAASVSAEAGAAAAQPPPPPPLPPSTSPFATASAAGAAFPVDETAAMEKLKARESALAQYVEEVDALARFVEGLEPSALGLGGGRAASAARVAKQVRLDALALRKRALADHWLDSAPSALDLFAMDAAMRRRFVTGGGGNGGGAGGRAGGGGRRSRPVGGGGTDAAIAAAAAALGASAAAARDAAAASGAPPPPAPPPRLPLGRSRAASGDFLGRAGSAASAGSGAAVEEGFGGGGGGGGGAGEPSTSSSSARRWSREVMRRMGLGGSGSGSGGGEGGGGDGGSGAGLPPPPLPPPASTQ